MVQVDVLLFLKPSDEMDIEAGTTSTLRSWRRKGTSCENARTVASAPRA